MSWKRFCLFTKSTKPIKTRCPWPNFQFSSKIIETNFKFYYLTFLTGLSTHFVDQAFSLRRRFLSRLYSEGNILTPWMFSQRDLWLFHQRAPGEETASVTFSPMLSIKFSKHCFLASSLREITALQFILPLAAIRAGRLIISCFKSFAIQQQCALYKNATRYSFSISPFRFMLVRNFFFWNIHRNQISVYYPAKPVSNLYYALL